MEWVEWMNCLTARAPVVLINRGALQQGEVWSLVKNTCNPHKWHAIRPDGLRCLWIAPTNWSITKEICARNEKKDKLCGLQYMNCRVYPPDIQFLMLTNTLLRFIPLFDWWNIDDNRRGPSPLGSKSRSLWSLPYAICLWKPVQNYLADFFR